MKLRIFAHYLWGLILSFCSVYFLEAQENQLEGRYSEMHQINFDLDTKSLFHRIKVPFTFKEEVFEMNLEKNSVFGKNTKCLIDDGTGNLVEVPMIDHSSYHGFISEKVEYSVCALMTDQGAVAKGAKKYRITERMEDIDTQRSCNAIKKDLHESNKTLKGDELHIQQSSSAVFSDLGFNQTSTTSINSQATLKPSKSMDILEFEIGVEIGSRSFFSSSAYNGNLSRAQSAAQSIVGNLNARFLHSAGVRFRLGRVIIRTNADTDPLRNTVTGTGTSSTARSSLAAFANYWSNNPDKVGNTHDLAVYHVKSAPSGLAYVGGLGRDRTKYATMGGNGPTSWANGTAAHEVGHVFGLPHVNQSRYFYETKPRNNQGTTTSGGNNFFISIMHGSGNHNIGRMPMAEVNKVVAIRNRERSQADLITNSGNIKPYGVFDEVSVLSTRKAPVNIDVIANDYDVNNDVLNVSLLDQISFLGGTITLSEGTGPGGRNEIQYTPPTSGSGGRDFFHYTVFDTANKKDFGTVYVDLIPGIDPNATVINFDLGTDSSRVFPDFIRVSNTTQNEDFGWINTSGLRAADRGSESGVNDLNRDFVYASNKATLETKVSRGVWKVLITFGDKNARHDNMAVKAEGVSKLKNITTEARQFLNQSFDVVVRDGKLSLEFSDDGGSDPNWAVNRVILKKVRDVIDDNATAIDFDLGTPNSPVFDNYIRLSNTSQNEDYGWLDTNIVGSRDRGSVNTNDLNRDFVFSDSTATLEVKVSPAFWSAEITFGDADFLRDSMSVKAEGISKLTNINTEKGQFLSKKFEVAVSDGKLTLEFLDEGGAPHWSVTRIRLKKVMDLNPREPPIGSVISLTGNNNLYVSSENGRKPMNCNRSRVGAWEKFEVVDAGDGKIGLRGNNGLYVSSENGNNPINCNRSRLDIWEKFDWEFHNGKIALKGNNGLYVSSKNGRGPMDCIAISPSEEELFNITILDVENSKSRSVSILQNPKEKVLVYPNPTQGLVVVDNLSAGDRIKIFNLSNQMVRNVKATSKYSIIDLSDLESGLYYVSINGSKSVISIIKN